ncbi:GNAT family N-acetyltransferase [Lacticaseibacillus paracasei]|uniref:GNAT family acetyltransferase n=1 Tax=Lacticaseibacillus paracasei N1115 TaxID=1446494 RepID=A0A806L5I9_LACPA|nr:GNAT family N-acetyltransferase [Lacticaseibacillus paracasei]AHJ32476.1 GNAT family acetyltransferase [Lacticaseibacillus paracasei N1115]EEI68184.1 acetyltransferase, GNAT family [Lacticaseibacillus paracasei subsp. paracasei ATCC 25302 = DSM 5622 = JCM 8130]KRM64274.1 GNAT family acetyltransferase [Lacticaseibacillus paracasei subsp. paracasei ATCC 25302 = DSM 5622 = JCM 8130]MBA4475201.1 GNAT family N-acetyltransferase [Lacticaseibacillus paracasei]MCT3335014.1 GNAT family N-acetyltrans
MKLHFSKAQLNDLDTIMTIETAGFTPQEAATRTSMASRITNYPDTFIVARAGGTIVGYVVGPATDQPTITDDLFSTSQPNRPDDPYIAVLSLAVSPRHRHQNVGSQLLEQLTQVARTQNRQAITLTCLQRLIPFYEHQGFQNEGRAASTHAGEVWYNMVKKMLY